MKASRRVRRSTRPVCCASAPIIMTTMAAVLGALPDDRHRRRLGLRHPLDLHRWRPARQPDADAADAVIYLWFDRLAVRFADGPQAYIRRAGSDRKSINPLHSASRRDRAADIRPRGGGCGGILQAAVAAAAGRLPDHLGAGNTAGRQSAGRRHDGGKPAGTTSRPDRDVGDDLDLDRPARPASPCSSGSTATSTERPATCRPRSMQPTQNLPTGLHSNATSRKVIQQLTNHFFFFFFFFFSFFFFLFRKKYFYG